MEELLLADLLEDLGALLWSRSYTGLADNVRVENLRGLLAVVGTWQIL